MPMPEIAGETIAEIYREGVGILRGAGVESPSFDAVCLLEKAFGFTRQGLLLYGEQLAKAAQAAEFRRMVQERAAGRPLQYILGEWPFWDLTLRVGEGVLIPREDTETLVRTAADMLCGFSGPQVLDLCAGSGAVGLALARELRGRRYAAWNGTKKRPFSCRKTCAVTRSLRCGMYRGMCWIRCLPHSFPVWMPL